ncbi:uncharacterized protein [Battus philenor]|uniref:uncharacterized protein n=1 Tax=Battus philenor TaxID=42288 RepID=UPI0035D084AE
MSTLLIVLLFGTVMCFSHGLPATVSEAHSAASQEVHLYLQNSTEGISSQLAPIVSEVKDANERIEYGRDSVLPFLTFLFDTLGNVGNEIEECIDDMVIQLIPDDPSDPGYPPEPIEVNEPALANIVSDNQAIGADSAAITPK